MEKSLGPRGEVHRPEPKAPQHRLGAGSTPKSTSAPFATDLPAGKPAWGATARLRRRAPATPGQCSAPAAHVGHLPPSGAARRVGCGQQVWPGRLWGDAETRGSGTRTVQLHAEPQAQQQGSTEQPPVQGSAVAPGRPGCGHDGDPGLRLQSGSHPQLRDASTEASPLAPGCQLWQLPIGPGVGPPSSLSQRRPRRNLILPSRKSEGRWARRAPWGQPQRDSKNTFLGSWALVSFASVTIRHRGGGKVSCQVLHQRKSSIKQFCAIKLDIKIKHTYARVYNFSPSRKEGERERIALHAEESN